MQYERWLTPVVIFFLAICAQAQFGNSQNSATGNVHIRVVLSNERSAGLYLMVRLMNGSSSSVVATSYTNSIGEADFIGIPAGEYHVIVSGDGIETTDSPSFEVDTRKVAQSEYVTVRSADNGEPRPLSPHSPTVSVANLNVPPKALKEVDKASEAMAEKNWKKAQEHLNKAIELAPKYAIAYNNLAVLYAKMNDIPHEEEALKKSIEIDDHFAPALVNYGKFFIREKNFPQAETTLAKAINVDPGNAETLMLLAESQYMNHHFDAAIASARLAHNGTPEHPSFVHYIAGRSYQQENRRLEALAEFQIFLKEEPKGPRADFVRNDVAKMEATAQRAPQ